MTTTQQIIERAIAQARISYFSINEVAVTEILTWPLLYNATISLRNARPAVTDLLTAFADTDRNVTTRFTEEFGQPVDIQIVFGAATLQSEAYNNEIFLLFDDENTRKKIVPADLEADRTVEDVRFVSPLNVLAISNGAVGTTRYDNIKNTATTIRDTLAIFA